MPQSPPGAIYSSSPGRPSPGEVVQNTRHGARTVRILPLITKRAKNSEQFLYPPTAGLAVTGASSLLSQFFGVSNRRRAEQSDIRALKAPPGGRGQSVTATVQEHGARSDVDAVLGRSGSEMWEGLRAGGSEAALESTNVSSYTLGSSW